MLLSVPDDATSEQMAEAAFEGDNSPYGNCDITERSGHCYSLSVGDMVIVDRHVFKCLGIGWKLMASPAR